jgi:hypothetical protein
MPRAIENASVFAMRLYLASAMLVAFLMAGGVAAVFFAVFWLISHLMGLIVFERRRVVWKVE